MSEYQPSDSQIIEYALDHSLLTPKEVRKIALRILGLPEDKLPDPPTRSVLNVKVADL